MYSSARTVLRRKRQLSCNMSATSSLSGNERAKQGAMDEYRSGGKLVRMREA